MDPKEETGLKRKMEETSTVGPSAKRKPESTEGPGANSEGGGTSTMIQGPVMKPTVVPGETSTVGPAARTEVPGSALELKLVLRGHGSKVGPETSLHSVTLNGADKSEVRGLWSIFLKHETLTKI